MPRMPEKETEVRQVAPMHQLCKVRAGLRVPRTCPRLGQPAQADRDQGEDGRAGKGT